MGNLTLNGATSGQITISPPAVAGSNTLTLPAATDTLVGKNTNDTLTNKTIGGAGIGFSGSTSGTITVQATAVAGTNTVTIAAQTGTLNAAGPAFSAYYNGTTQTIPASTWTKATMNAKDFDTNTNYDATTNYRFTPTVAGYYYISASVPLAGGASVVGVNLAIYKNGIIYKGTSTNLPSSTNGNLSISLPILLNGSTDYVEIYVYSGGQATAIYGSSSTIYGGANSNTSLFNGYLIRGV